MYEREVGGGVGSLPLQRIDRTIYLVYYLVMSTISMNMHDAKTRLSEVIANLRPGDRVVLCRRNRPVAEIRPLPSVNGEPRPIGKGKGLVVIPPTFFHPLPEDVLKTFEASS